MGKLFGLIGHPVGHSMSPSMHNNAFHLLHQNHHYHAFDVSEADLQAAIAGFRAIGISGFNITIPHKVEVMKYLDEVDEEAKLIGAVNTVVNDNGRLFGYNTDGEGYLQSLLKVTGDQLKQMRVLLIGAGGAARAVLTVLSRYGVEELHIANRTKEKAASLASECNQSSKDAFVWSIEEAEQKLHQFDLIINTTSVGMSPNVDQLPIALNNIKQDAVVSDLIYNPLKTKLLQEAEAKGATVLNGVGMFVEQGALAFEKWTGTKPDRNEMEKIVLQQLGGVSNSC
ncbi:shikimate dehydrogenase [Alkalihalophilus pseudofirmus]|uniref:shikimate dehydrogenase n=1 Tax=Alkalihalobacterium alkalinitrilicum TaxID=427920 RepID=UPI00094C7D32|nr:shikimate dehydrogenase [Alkalihalobacterium alkalinitrilicum]OLO38850.1 shikimate dehydrogenase [Alkalihalophilus pseudofirmus]